MRIELCLVVMMTAGASLAGTVSVRTYGGVPSESGRVVVRDIKPLDPPPSGGESAAAFSIVPQLSWPSSDYDVRWFRFNLLMGSHRSVRGFDLGLLGNMADCESSGLSFAGLFNTTGQSAGAVHLAGLFNYSSWDFSGVQLAAALSWTEGVHTGVQFGVATSAGRLRGLQLGVVNCAEQGAGVQLGVVNTSDRMTGLQLGLLNINLDSSVPVLPLINFAF